MSSSNDEVPLQSLLRFLTQIARLPLPQALSLAKPLNAADLSSPSALADTPPAKLAIILSTEEKLAKQIHSAAKRALSKRDSSSTTGKRKSGPTNDNPATKSRRRDTGEAALALPEACTDDVEILEKTVLTANRAPLLLAFAVVLLRFTMPEQPLSSRLSLGQGLVSVNARGKAEMIGLRPERKGSAGDRVGRGWRGVNIMGRDVAVLPRDDGGAVPEVADMEKSPEELKESADKPAEQTETREPALWALDVEAVEKSEGGAELPIHTPSGARAYLLKSFASSPSSSEKPLNFDHDNGESSKAKKRTETAVKANNLSRLLRALELLFASWSSAMSREELNEKAWTWYCRVRPDVEHGPGGWGGKGKISLGEILSLRKK